MHRQQRHSWRDRTDDGEVIYYRAVFYGKEWILDSQLKGEDEWNRHEPMSRRDWKTLREVLWRKYQRKRVPWKLIENIDKLLEGLPKEE